MHRKQNLISETLKSLFIKFLTPVLTCELKNSLDDWLKSTSPTNHAAGYQICWLRGS